VEVTLAPVAVEDAGGTHSTLPPPVARSTVPAGPPVCECQFGCHDSPHHRMGSFICQCQCPAPPPTDGRAAEAAGPSLRYPTGHPPTNSTGRAHAHPRTVG